MRSSRQLWTQKLSGQTTSPRHAPSWNPPAVRPQYTGCVLGIDPSLRGTGLALIQFSSPQTFQLLHSETVRLKTTATAVECLGAIFSSVSNILDQCPVRHVALEQIIYVQNFRTAHIMGSARGAAMAAIGLHKLSAHEYPPLRVKQAVIGFGRASKEQVAKTTQQLLCLPKPLPYDEADAAAVAFCHAFTFCE